MSSSARKSLMVTGLPSLKRVLMRTWAFIPSAEERSFKARGTETSIFSGALNTTGFFRSAGSPPPPLRLERRLFPAKRPGPPEVYSLVGKKRLTFFFFPVAAAGVFWVAEPAGFDSPLFAAAGEALGFSAGASVSLGFKRSRRIFATGSSMDDM